MFYNLGNSRCSILAIDVLFRKFPYLGFRALLIPDRTPSASRPVEVCFHVIYHHLFCIRSRMDKFMFSGYWMVTPILPLHLCYRIPDIDQMMYRRSIVVDRKVRNSDVIPGIRTHMDNQPLEIEMCFR